MSIWHWIVFLFAIGVYLLPTLIAFARDHHQKIAIMLLDLFLGWTFLGWVAALVWSATATSARAAFVPPTIGARSVDVNDWRSQIGKPSKFDQLNGSDRR